MIAAPPKTVPQKSQQLQTLFSPLPLSFLSPDLFTSLSPPSPLFLSLFFLSCSLMISLRLCVSVPLPGSLSLETGLVAWLPSAAWVVFCVSACTYARARVHVGLFL